MIQQKEIFFDQHIPNQYLGHIELDDAINLCSKLTKSRWPLLEQQILAKKDSALALF